MAMGRGEGRSLVLICAVATLLLISSSAVSGVFDENVREFGRFAGRLGRQHFERGARGVEDSKQFGSQVVVEESKPAEGFLEKARSFLSGFSTSIGNGIHNPTSYLFGRKIWAGPQKEEEEEKVIVGREGHFFGRHHGFGQKRWAGIRDLIRNHPEKLAAAASSEVSATEPLVVEEDAIPVVPVPGLLAKIKGVVMTVVEEYNVLPVEPEAESTCVDALEKQVKIFVKSVKSALRDRLCNCVVSLEEQTFCNLVNEHPMMATYQSLWMTHVNPVKVSWHKTSKTAVCSSVNPFSSFLDNLEEMEGLARQYIMLLPEVSYIEDMHMEHDDEYPMFGRHRLEHGPHERHWWRRMFHMKTRQFEGMREHGPEVINTEDMHMEHDHEHPMFGRHRLEHGPHERHWWRRMFRMKTHHFEGMREHGPEVINTEDMHMEHDQEHPMFGRHRLEHGPHERHWWQRMFHMKTHHFEGMREHGESQWVHMKPHHLEETDEHGDHEKHGERVRMRPHHFEGMREHGDHEQLGERQWGDMKPRHFEGMREHGARAKHWWQRLFGMLHKHKQMRHFGFEHAHNISAGDVCFLKSVKSLHRGMKQHLVTACQSTTSPNVIAACEFAKEHHFLVKSWLALKIPVGMKAAKSCIHTFEDRHAPDLGMRRFEIVERGYPVEREDLASNEAGETNERQRQAFPHWISRGCGKHQANRGFNKALHLRGHVMGMNHGETGLRGLVRTHLIVLGGNPLHLHDFHGDKEDSQPEDTSSAETLTDLQEKLVEFVRDAVSGEHRGLEGMRAEMTFIKPFHHRANFRISAEPRVVEISDGPHFRISAMPRGVGDANSEVSDVGPNDVVVDADDSEIKLEAITSDETAEKVADM